MTRQSHQDRRAVILEAASEVFFEQGYEAATIDAVIARSGGSKRNIYSEFGSKEGLFTALVSESAAEALSTLAVDQINGRTLEETLFEFARRLLSIYTSDKLIGVYRTIVTAGTRFPALAEAFYRKGPGHSVLRLTEVLEAARNRGEISASDCAMAADHFLGMLRSNLHLQLVLGLRPPPSSDELVSIARSSVSTLLASLKADS